MNYDIQLLWEEGRCPIISGIIYSDGTVKILNPKEEEQYNYVPEYSRSTTMDEISKVEEIEYTHIYKYKSIEIAESKLKVYFGEGAWGSEGFVAICDSIEDKLQWIAYFDYSNPMIKVEYTNGIISAYSNLGHKWIFDLKCPENVKVELNASNIYFYKE